MKKIINMRTKEEMVSLPFDKDQAEQLISHILNFQAPESVADSYCFMMENVLCHLIVNSNADMNKIQLQIEANKAKGA